MGSALQVSTFIRYRTGAPFPHGGRRIGQLDAVGVRRCAPLGSVHISPRNGGAASSSNRPDGTPNGSPQLDFARIRGHKRACVLSYGGTAGHRTVVETHMLLHLTLSMDALAGHYEYICRSQEWERGGTLVNRAGNSGDRFG